MYRSADSTGDRLWVDWATLTTTSILSLDIPNADAVSLEQQALNDASNARQEGTENIAP